MRFLCQVLVYNCRENNASFYRDEEVQMHSEKAEKAEHGICGIQTPQKQSDIQLFWHISMGVYEIFLVLQLFSLIEFSGFLNLSPNEFPL